jgi:hypothetical protein
MKCLHLRKIIAFAVAIAYFVALSLLFVRLDIPMPIFEAITGILFIPALIGFPFAIAEKRQLYEKYWPKDDMLTNTPRWFKLLWVASFIVVCYFYFLDGFRSGYFLAIGGLAVETAILAPFLFVNKITLE